MSCNLGAVPLMWQFSFRPISPEEGGMSSEEASRASTPPKSESSGRERSIGYLKGRVVAVCQGIAGVVSKGATVLKKCVVGEYSVLGASRKKISSHELLYSQLYVGIQGLNNESCVLKRYCAPSADERPLAQGQSLETIKKTFISLMLGRVEDMQELIKKYSTSVEMSSLISDEIETIKQYLNDLKEILLNSVKDGVNLSQLNEVVKCLLSSCNALNWHLSPETILIKI